MDENPHDCVQVRVRSNERARCVPAADGSLLGVQVSDLNAVLARYTTTLEDDSVVLEKWRKALEHGDRVHASRMVALVSFRMTEKRLLRKLIADNSRKSEL